MRADWDLSSPEGIDALWVAVGQVLLALGVRAETVRQLGELRPVYDRWEQELSDRWGRDVPLHSLSRRRRAQFDDDLGRALAILISVGGEALEHLDRHRIRPEILGLRREALDQALEDLRRYAASEAWRGADEAAVRDHLTWILDGVGWSTIAVEPEPGEVDRIVAVLSEVPRPTVTRFLGVSSRPALKVMIGGWFLMVRSGEADAAHAEGAEPANRRFDPEAAWREQSAQREAELEERLERNRRKRERDERRFEHRGPLMRWMGLVGAVPALVGLMVAAAGAAAQLAGAAVSFGREALPLAGEVASVSGVVAMLVLVLIAFLGSRRISEDQRLLRSNTAGGMLALLGLCNVCLGLPFLAVSLTEPEYRTAGILGGALTVVAFAVAVIGAAQRDRARKRAGLPREDPTVYVP